MGYSEVVKNEDSYFFCMAGSTSQYQRMSELLSMLKCDPDFIRIRAVWCR